MTAMCSDGRAIHPYSASAAVVGRAMAFSPSAPSPSTPPPQLPHKLDTIRSMDELKQIQAAILKTPSPQSSPVLAKILSFCALSSPHIAHARSLLAHIDNPSLLMYNTVFHSLSRSNRSLVSTSIMFYEDMLEKGLRPDSFTFPYLVKLFANSQALQAGEALHAHAIKMGLDANVYVRNNLMSLYAVCGEVRSIWKLFDGFPERDLVSWTTLISGYTKAGLAKEAVEVFKEMLSENLRADGVTMVAVLSACAELGDLELGRNLHRYIGAREVDMDVFVGNALVYMYSKCGDVDSAYQLFNQMPVRNVVSWNSMISGLVNNREFKQALELFRQMQSEGIEPDAVTLVGVLNSCASLGALELGQWVHAYINRNGIEADGITGNALVDMYAKCGRIDRAMEVFGGMAHKDVYTYTSMIVGLAMHGRGEEALDLFAAMSSAGVKPNEVTFVGVLSACSHAGLVDVGLRHFESMSAAYGLVPQMEHYGCVVDMFGRAGRLDKAQDFISSMPMEPDAFIWGSLLGACRKHGDVALGETVAKRLLDVEPQEEGAYVLMSNLYTAGNRRSDGLRMRKAMRANKVRKTPGCSLIEIDGVIHEFRKGEELHPLAKEVYAMVAEFGRRLNIDSSQDEARHHSERLAMAFGLIGTRPDTPLRIVKNLRVCHDCHSVIKSVSRLYNREIVLRDRYRFHRFKDGWCSCNEFW
ncbi:Pentatricopeptide repeat-containing protein [Musa troglodytarum]|uniref:Pentatricopeptide repeat-containing protein n=1 Tax=Musa troglodytarum TaxID=320322 RepID=A0A9E7GY84_9LILI|nr:Pentatricopeptide repeat-containing protein [Musa troglodytarum]